MIAFPTPAGAARLSDTDKKALYYRCSVSSGGNPPRLPVAARRARHSPHSVCSRGSGRGPHRQTWAGRPPLLGRTRRSVDHHALRAHGDGPDHTPGAGRPDLALRPTSSAGPRWTPNSATLRTRCCGVWGRLFRVGDSGLTMLHFDSWEMSSQNWSRQFRQEFSRDAGTTRCRTCPR